MKRILSLVLCAILLVTAIPFSVTAEGAKPQLVLSSAETTTSGGEVALTVRALNAADLRTARIWVKTASPLKITGATAAETVPDYVVIGPTEGEYAEANGVTFEWVGETALGSDDAALATYTVSVPEGTAAGEYAVELVVSADDMLDKDQNEIAFETVSGKITVVDESTAVKLVVGSAEATTAGGEVALTVRALNAAELRAARIWVKVASPLKITGAVAAQTLPDYVVIGPTEGEYAETNGVTFEWASKTSLGDEAALATYTVSVPAGTAAGEYAVEIVVSAEDMLDKDQNELVCIAEAGKITVTESSEKVYTLTEWKWTEDNTAQAVFTCTTDPSDFRIVDATVDVQRTDATCENEGSVTCTAKATFDGKEYTDTKIENIPALGHAYGEPIWTWDGNSAASAKFVCANDETHVETVTATIDVQRTDPTPDEGGSVVYTAKVVFGGKEYTDIKTEELPPLGRTYTLTGWEWNDDNTSAQAVFTCTTDPSDVRKVNAVIDTQRTDATCEEAGSVTYTAKATFDGKEYTDTKTETLPALGHAYGEPEWTWDGNSAASAKFVCANDETHVETVVATIETQRTDATCEEAGSVTYTAKANFDGKEYNDTKTETLPALGHAYGAPVWTWDGNSAASAKFVCANDAAHVETLVATVDTQRTEPTCEEAGSATYTAKVTFGGNEYTDTKTETFSATGHAYGAPVWTWDGYTKASVTFTCVNDAAHKMTSEATIGSDVITEPSYVAPGLKRYTAKITVDGKEYTDIKDEVLPQKVHNYGEPTWTWSEDYSNVSVAFVNVDDPADVATLSAAVTSVRVDPTVDKEGSVTYTATITVMGKEYTDVKVVVLPKLDKVFEMSFGEIEAFENGKKIPGEIRVVGSEGVSSAKMTVELPEGVSIESVTGIDGTARMTKSNAKAGGTSVEITWTSAGADVKGTKSIVKIMFTLPRGTKIGDKLEIGLAVTEAANKAGEKVLFEGKTGSIDFTHVFFDVDNNGRTNAKDIIATMRYMLNVPQSVCIASRADANLDGRVNAKDIIVAMRYMLGIDIPTHYGQTK